MSNPSAYLHALSAVLPERAQHDRITRAEDTIADAYGLIGRPWRADTLLDRLERRGDIDRAQHHAGEHFHRLFHLAGMQPLRAADMLRDRANVTTAHGAEPARRRLHAALDALGGISSPCGSAVWFIVGCEFSINEWCRREGWGSRPIRHETAKGLLIGGLGVLAGHFRTGSP